MRLAVDGAKATIAVHGGAIDETQDATHLVVEFLLPYLTFKNELAIGISHKVVVVGIGGAHREAIGPGAKFEVKAIVDGFLGALCATPVADDGAIEAPFTLEDLVHKVLVVAGMLTTEEVVASHQCPGTTFANGCLESGQIDLAEGTLVAESIGGVALVLVVVERIVLHADCHALLLHALDVAHCHAAREEGVFAHILETAAIERGATDVDARTEENGLVAIACLFADGLTIAEGKIGVPGGCQAGQRRECRTRVVAATSLLPFVPKHVGADAVRAIGTPEFGNT